MLGGGLQGGFMVVMRRVLVLLGLGWVVVRIGGQAIAGEEWLLVFLE
jgi:hypothetical protein